MIAESKNRDRLKNRLEKELADNVEDNDCNIREDKESKEDQDKKELADNVENEKIEMEIMNVEHAIDNSNISIKKATDIINGFQVKLNALIHDRDNLGDRLKILKNKRFAYVGNFCSDCNATISEIHTSNRCSMCYQEYRNNQH